MIYKVDDIAWTMNQRLKDEPYGWELLKPRKVKITDTTVGTFYGHNDPSNQSNYYTAYLCDEYGNTHCEDQCRCRSYELYRTEQEATIAYKEALKHEIGKLKNLLANYTDTLILLETQDLDNQPLPFGKHKGHTPNQLLEKDPSYITWMYENVKAPTCSSQLYEKAKQGLEKEALIEEMRYYYDAEDYGDR